MNRISFSILLLPALLAGCTLMPKYDRPPAPVSSSWPNASKPAGATSAAAADIAWRDFFEDARLQSLIALTMSLVGGFWPARTLLSKVRSMRCVRAQEDWPPARATSE